ncbi:Aminomethyltransferase folate-binding domain-containing protein [Rhizopus microsporus]|uniref:Aminomethyltransferase folate-binding domain-containing protein n=1 Tax=Rhizopus microsporus TaxID=58291 RepID=A0A1X0S7W6_RHIZD|nr:Aminomethyltransferase folate-binding domain-containing protein [Rhizopus microsporus]
MPKISPGGDGFFTAFLTPQGRMLYDAFIYPVNVGVNFPHPKFIVDIPTASKDMFVRHLKRYILRSKVKVRDCSDEYKLWHVWGDALNHEHRVNPTLIKKEKRLSNVGCHDPRVPGFGYRAALPADQSIHHSLHELGEFKELEIDFRKGCYIGQELTIRTYHTGIIRKRIVPVQIYRKDESASSSTPRIQAVDRTYEYPSDALQPQKDIKLADGSSKRGVGKVCSGIHNIGLALMRLEHVQKFAQGEDVAFTVDNDVYLAPFLPEWWSENQIQ